jgi:hypothetical protein
MLTLTVVLFIFFIISRLLGTAGVRELVSLAIVDELVGTCAGEFDSNFGGLHVGTSEDIGYTV